MSHARLAPSNKRWPSCPGSVEVEKDYPDVAGQAAIDGTGSHELLELCLKQSKLPADYLGGIIGANHEDKPSGWLVCEERAKRVQMCLDYLDRRVEELAEEYPTCSVNIESETRSNPGSFYGRDDWWGSVDVTLTVTNRTGIVVFVEVCDYKDGRGYVKVPNNTQLISYLGGKMKETTGAAYCRMSIVQPKTNPVCRYDDLHINDLMVKLDDLAEAADKTDDPNAPLVPGDHCQYCLHKPNCTAGAEKALSVIGEPMELLELTKDIKSVPAQRLAELDNVKKDVIAAFEKVEAEIKRRVEAGEEVSDGDEMYILGKGSKKRVWNEDEGAMYKVLKARRLKKDQIYPAKLITVAQALKHPDLTKKQKEQLEADFVTEIEGNPVLKRVTKKETLPVTFM